MKLKKMVALTRYYLKKRNEAILKREDLNPEGIIEAKSYYLHIRQNSYSVR